MLGESGDPRVSGLVIRYPIVWVGACATEVTIVVLV